MSEQIKYCLKSTRSEQGNAMGHEQCLLSKRKFDDMLPLTHEIKTIMPLSPAYHTGCLLLENGSWESVTEIHPMSDLHRSFVERGIVAFPKS